MSRIVPATEDAIAAAVERWRNGRLVAFPTETVYGLGAWARHDDALRAVYAAKGRPERHPLIVHLPDTSALVAWARDVPEAAWRLAEAFWPGPLTLVLQRADQVPDLVTGGQATVALRVPAHPTAQALLRAFGDGIAAPSANRFGHVSPTTAQHVAAEFPTLDLLVVDGGPCEVGLESTIVDLSTGRPRLLRPGGVRLGRVVEVLGEPVEDATATAVVHLGEKEPRDPVPRTPGSLERHYAPRTPATMVDDAGAATRGPESRAGCAVMARRPAPAGYTGAWRALPDDPDGYGRMLYATLRELDDAGHRCILIERVPDDDPWRAVHDRLRRATAASHVTAPTDSARRNT
ncbi:MAG: L-threonylcarbamoyladenylate synthase [Trueperaceae bacterium]